MGLFDILRDSYVEGEDHYIVWYWQCISQNVLRVLWFLLPTKPYRKTYFWLV